MAPTLCCPRCRAPLEPDNIHDHGVVANAASCPTCKGFFIALELLTQVEMEERSRLFEFRVLLHEKDQLQPLACPGCDATMEKVRSSRDKHVVMDVCRPCEKVWLDHDELTAIRTESLASMVSQLVRFLRQRRAG